MEECGAERMERGLPRRQGSEVTNVSAARNKHRSVTEDDLLRAVLDLARIKGWRCAHFRSVKTQRPDGSTRWLTPVQGDGVGFPDLILLRGDRGIAWELKSDVGQGTDEQAEWLTAFKAAGLEARFVRPKDWDYIEKELTR